MALSRRSGRGPLTRPQRRLTSWSFGPDTAQASQSVTASGKFGLSVFINILQDGLTLVRTRGQIKLWLEAATAAANGYIGAFGICRVSTQAATIGSTAVPGPIAEDDWDGWLFYEHIQCVAPAALNSGVASDLDQLAPVTATQVITIDSKAMRKVKENDALLGIFELTEVGTATLRFAGGMRMLFKLP